MYVLKMTRGTQGIGMLKYVTDAAALVMGLQQNTISSVHDRAAAITNNCLVVTIANAMHAVKNHKHVLMGLFPLS